MTMIIKMLFDKAEEYYLKQIEEKDKEKYEAMKYQAEVLRKIREKLEVIKKQIEKITLQDYERATSF